MSSVIRHEAVKLDPNTDKAAYLAFGLDPNPLLQAVGVCWRLGWDRLAPWAIIYIRQEVGTSSWAQRNRTFVVRSSLVQGHSAVPVPGHKGMYDTPMPSYTEAVKLCSETAWELVQRTFRASPYNPV